MPIFVRGIRRPLPLSPVARCRLLCAVCSSFGSRRCAVRVSVAVPLCRRRQLLAGALCRSCSADWRHVWVRFTGIIGSPCGVFAVPRSSPISDLWFLSCASCDGLGAAVLLSIGLAAPAFLRPPRASPRGLRLALYLSDWPSPDAVSRRCRMANDDPVSDLFDQLAARLAPQFSVSSERS